MTARLRMYLRSAERPGRRFGEILPARVRIEGFMVVMEIWLQRRAPNLRCTDSEPCISCAGTFVYGGNERVAKPPRN